MKKRKEKVNIQTYVNAKLADRVAASMSRALALRIAVGDQNAIDLVIDAIAARIEAEETGALG